MTATAVLVHGAFHAAWCWEPVVAGLEARAVPVVAVDLPGRGAQGGELAGLSDSAAHLRSVLETIEGPLVVVGHSFGGAVAAEGVPDDAPVRELVFVAALVPEPQTAAVDPQAGLTDAPLVAAIDQRDGLAYFDGEHAAEIFYGDCDAGAVAWAVERLGPEPLSMFTTPLSRAAWRAHPSRYVVCERDGAIPPAVQERYAKRCTSTLRWDCDHSPMLSHPEWLVDLLTELCA